MSRRNRSTVKGSRTPQASKRTRVTDAELELLVRFADARRRDREGTGR